MLTGVHNRLLRPDEWFVDAGRLVFLEENQAVVFWGVPVAAADDDPAVDQGVNGSTIEWHSECDQCCLRGWTALGSIHELQAYSKTGTALCHVPWVDGPRIFVAGVDEANAATLADEFGIRWDPERG